MGNTNTKPFGVKDKIGYMCGDIANDFTFIFASSYNRFYIKVMGVPAGMVGTMFCLQDVWMHLVDIGMGRIVDNSKSIQERTHPSVDSAYVRICCTGINHDVPVISGRCTACAKLVTCSSLTFYGDPFSGTSVNIPYGSMASVISSEPKDRSSLSVFRSSSGTLAGILIGMFAPMVVYYTDEAGNKVVSASKISMIAGIFPYLLLSAIWLCYTLTTERVACMYRSRMSIRRRSTDGLHQLPADR